MTALKKNFFILFFTLVTIIFSNSFLFSYQCSYDWQHDPHWLCDVNNQYYETWEECDAYCFVAEDSGNSGNTGNTGDLDLNQINFLNGLAGILSAFLVWQAWNNANK